ncbi:MAG TPA: energy transducer TonB [Candidatus Bathyarchaeia archaeon]|nr:energy transducer TonB [Candidatus Bathyarchaeia archaeon]
MAILTWIRRGRVLGFGASCLFHAGLIAGLLVTERWLLSVDAIRPPVLLAEVVTPADVAPAPEVRTPPEPKRQMRLPAKLPRLLSAPLPPVAEAVTPPPVSMPTAPESPPKAMASAPPPASVSDATAPGAAPASVAASAPAAAPAGTGVPSTASRAVASASAREPGSITQTARPQGGYQVRPSYPSSALREGKQGTTMLRVHVMVDGRVGEVIVQQSAGHPDLDQAAIDAVRRWRFDPARRGSEPVAMWVLLPVEFQIR